jgi:NAD(P)-dependent dehydrogenase (short-subunit alcohol dehydrogenase family)
MEKHLANKVVIVTGAAAGIGRATALSCAHEGAKVIVADMMRNEGDEVVEQIKKRGGEASFILTDVSNHDNVKNLITQSVKIYGTIDCAVNNAGIEGEQAPTAESTEKNWDRVISINLKGTWFCMKYELEYMLKQKSGSIVNMSSVAGIIGYEGICAYTASKHGIIGLTKTAALEYARSGIRVNAICPGVIRTAMIERFVGEDPDAAAALTSQEPIGRMGKPQEVAEATVWLCSDVSSFVTGHALVVDGGMVAG